MNVTGLIKKKRDGGILTTHEISDLIRGYVAHKFEDHHMASFLMAVFFQGMHPRECTDLTLAMAGSGECVDLSALSGPTVDKHSTGGVGDSTTLVLAPLVAACGGVVAKMTGRELGHTGGTVDKLESIPGLCLELTRDRFLEIANRIGVCLAAQSDTLAPADKKIYKLRHATATIESIPLIAASIMSKKLAAGCETIVLDVKTGAGSFVPDLKSARRLARTMVGIGRDAKRNMVAHITAMDQPLGRAVGNSVELKEAIQTLRGNGPKDLTELVLTLGSSMLTRSGVCESVDSARNQLQTAIQNRSGLDKLANLVSALGGDASLIKDPSLLPQALHRVAVAAPATGKVTAIDAIQIGMAAKFLGAGRQDAHTALDPSVGIVLNRKVGQSVEKGAPLATLYTCDAGQPTLTAREMVLAAYTIDGQNPPPLPLILETITAAAANVQDNGVP